MPPVVAFLTTIGTMFGLAGTAAAIAGAAVIVGASIAARALIPKIDMGVVDTDRARQTTVRSTIEPRKLIYGETMVSGVVSFAQVNGANNKNLHQVIAIAGHKLESIDKIFFDDYSIDLSTQVDGSGDVTSGKFAKKTNEDGVLETMVHIETRDGSSTQTAYSDLVTAFAGTGVNAGKGYESTHRGDNVASIYTRWTIHEGTRETWDEVGGIQNIKAVVKGKAVYDPRLEVAANGGDATTAGDSPNNAAYITYSNGSTTATHQRDLQGQNPALILADYLMDATFGLGVPSTKIDWAAVITAADACDFLVPIPTSQTQKRFFGSGVIFGSDSHRKSISKILSGMNGDLIYSQGKYIIKAGIHETAALTFTEDDLAGDFKVQTSIPRADRYNTIKGMFIDPDSNYKMTEFSPRTVADAVARDNGEVLEEEIKLTFTSDRYAAQRIAIKQVHKSFLQTTLTLPVNLKGMKVAVGDRIKLALNDFATISSDWNPSKEFKVIGWSFSESGNGAIELDLVEDDSSRYVDPAEADYNQISNTGVITSSLPPVPLPTNFTATAGYNSVNLAWTNPTNIGAWEQIWIYASDTTTPPTTPIEKFRGTAFTHQIAGGTTKYYWIQAVKYPLGATPASGSTNTSKSALVPFGSPTAVTALKIANAVMDDDSIDTAQIITDAVGSAQIAQTLQSDNWATTSGASGWQINKSGSATFQTATIKGGITATSGTIGGFTIGSTDLIAGDGATRVSLSTADGISLGNNTFSNAPFRVTRAGVLTATSGSIGNSVTVGGTAASTVASDSAAGNQAADQISLLPRADDSEWTVGTGAKGIWNANEDTSENAVVVENGPHGELERIWKATSTDGSAADGGFENTSTANRFPIVSDTTYRFSVFIKQDNTNGTIYFGAYNYSDTPLNIDLYAYNGTGGSNNKYWFANDLPTQGEWYLLVGFINPSNTNSNSGKGGIYNLATGVKVTAFDDFRFSGDGSETDATTFSVRTYNFYANPTPTSIVRWAHPRVDRLDRRAPSIAELLRGWTSLAEPINAGVTITGGGITMSSGGSIKGGQTAFNTGTGFFLGYDATSPAGYKFSVGNAGNNSLTFEDGALSVSGTVNASAGAFTGDVSTDSKFVAGSADDVAVVDGGNSLYRFYAGNSDPTSASFRVDKDGHIDATNIRIYDSNGQVILDDSGLHGVGLGNISADSGVGVAEVAGKLDSNTDEITFTTGSSNEVYTFEPKVQIDINQNGESGETPSTSNLSFAGASTSAVTTIIGQVKLIVEYFVKTSGGSYSGTPTATQEFTFVSGTSANSSQLGVSIFTLNGRGAGVVYANIGASEAISDPAISGARTFVRSSTDLTFASAGTYNIKINARIATLAGTTLTTATTPALDASVTTGTGVILGTDETQSSLEDFRRLYTIKPASGNANTIVASTTDDTFSSTSGSSLLTTGGTISGNLVVTGDLTVQGTTTTINVADLTVADKDITLNYSTGDSSATANNAGIIIQDAVSSTTDASLLWKTANDTFQFSHAVTWPSGSSANANTAYTYSQVGHLPLAGGTLTGGLTGTTGTFSGRVQALNYGNDNDAKFYAWRAINNTSSQNPNYKKIARLQGAQSQRFMITLTGRNNSYGDGEKGSKTEIYGQLNNDNNYDLSYTNYDFDATGPAVTEVGYINVTSLTVDIYVKVGGFSELAAYAIVSDGTLTPDSSSSATTTAPTGYTAATSNTIWTDNSFSSTSITSWNTAYTYSQVGHLPLAGGALTGNLDIKKTGADTIVDIRGNSDHDPILNLRSDQNTITTEGFQIWYDNSVGDVHLHTTYENDLAAIRFHTRTGTDKATNNERFTINGNGLINITTGNLAMNGSTVISNDRSIDATSIEVTGSYSGGSGDYTNVSNAQLKIGSAGTSDYWRIPHFSQSTTISGVYNYQTGKDVYWGEQTDTGTYYFRGRNLEVTNGTFSSGAITANQPLILNNTVAGNDTGDFKIIQSLNASGGVGYAASILGVNIDTAVNTNNLPTQDNAWGGVSGSAALVMSADISDGLNSFRFMTTPQSSSAGTVLSTIATMDYEGGFTANGYIRSDSSYKIGTITVIDANSNLTNIGTISSGAITSTASASTFTSTGTMDINLVANPPELNFEDTSSTSGTKRARWTLDNNNFSAQALSDNDGAVTQALLNFALSSGAATFGGAITSGSHLINASSSAFGGSSVQGFNTDFLVDSSQGYSRHNSYHTGGSNHQFLVNATGSTTNTVALAINKDANATFAGTISSGAITSTGAITGASFINTAVRYIANQIQSGYGDNSDNSDIWINYTGYQGGTTYFRDFRVGNGKQAQLFFVDGSAGSVSVTNGLTVGGTTSSGAIASSGRIDITTNSSISEPYVALGITSTTTSAGFFLHGNGGSKWEVQSISGGDLIFYDRTSSAYRARIMANGNFKIESGNLQMGGTTVIDSSRNLTSGIGTFEGGGNTLTLKKGTGTPALAFAGTASDPQATALIEGVSGGGLTIYTSSGTISSPSWSPKITLAANGDTTFAGTISGQFNLNVSGNITSSGNISSGGSNQVAKVFQLPNTAGTARWIKIGNFAASQAGDSITLRISTNAGYNASDAQNSETFWRFKTSNNSSNQSGFYGDSQVYKWGPNGSPSQFRIVQVTTTSFDFYAYFAVFSGTGSFVTAEHGTGTFTKSMALSTSDPGGLIVNIQRFLTVDNLGSIAPEFGSALTLPQDKRFISAPNSTWSSSISFGGNGHNVSSTQCSVATTNGNLHLDAASGNAAYINWYGGTSGVYIGNGAQSPKVFIDSSGNITAAGNITAYGSPSDLRLKENIEVIPDALAKVKCLRGVTFNYKKDGGRSTGLIAQELQEVLPEVVYATEDIDTKEEHLAVRYGNVVGLLVEAIKELTTEVEYLKLKLKEK